MTTYRVGTHHGVTICREGDGHQCGRPDHDCARGHLVAVVVNDDQALAERIVALLNDDGCTRVGMHNCAGTWSDHDHPDGRPGPPILRAEPRCICNDPPPTVDKPKNGTASRPPGWACPRHGTVI